MLNENVDLDHFNDDEHIYYHKVQYYETDKMGITHHSNYIRWMEEARVWFLDLIGYSFDRIEKEGLVSPVVSVNGEYKKTTTFSDTVAIEVKVASFNGIKLVLDYTMKNEDGALVFKGNSVHCFLNEKGMPVRLHKEKPQLYELLMNLVQNNGQ